MPTKRAHHGAPTHRRGTGQLFGGWLVKGDVWACMITRQLVKPGCPSWVCSHHSNPTPTLNQPTNQPHTQGQASDILIQAKEIERLRDLLVSLYVKHCGQNTEAVGEWD